MITLAPETRARVDAVQARLDARGVKSMAFFKDESWNDLTLDQRANNICDVLEAMLDNKCIPFKFNDSKPLQTRDIAVYLLHQYLTGRIRNESRH